MKILVAEDNVFYRLLLVSTLNEWGYETIAVENGAAAWDILRRDDAPRLAILDWMMPEMDGLAVCRRLRALPKPEPTYVIVITAKDGKGNIVAALDSGADDYITKPFERDELRARLQVGIRIVGLQTSQSVVFAFARAVEAKSPYTQGHAARVTRYALGLADRVGVSPAERELLRRGGLLHDIGKICVPDAILDKPGALTPEETAVIQQHPAQGAAIVEPLHSMHDIIPLIRWHHERMDGKGYPDGLREPEIPFLVRVLSVADVYDALSSKRPYRDAIPHAQCIEILRTNAARGGLERDLVEQFALAHTHTIDDRLPTSDFEGHFTQSIDAETECQLMT